MSHQSLDTVVLVDKTDHPIGVMDKYAAHRGEGQLHRAISVYLLRKNGQKVEVLLQQRSQEKIVGAGQWANTVCGNVRPGETYRECALRRLREEVGIFDAQIEAAYKFTYQVACNAEFSEHEIDQVFVGWWDGEVTLNNEEVAQVDWVDLEAIFAQAAQHGWAPDSEVSFDDKPLAPWFVWMLGDGELRGVLEGWELNNE